MVLELHRSGQSLITLASPPGRNAAQPLPHPARPIHHELRSASAPGATRFHRPELDLLRLLAFLMVWMAHASLAFSAYFPQRLLTVLEGAGSCGVPIFFILSSYLITELFRREKLTTGTVHLRHFYIRRTLRIWPLYFGVLALYSLLGLRFHGFRIEPQRLLASALFLGNWYLVLHPAITTPMRALWSISVEEQWYGAWPWLHRKLSRPACIALCVGVIAASQGLLFVLGRNGSTPALHVTALHVTAWVNSGVQFQYFAMGTAAAVLLAGHVPKLRHQERCALTLLGMAAILCAAGPCHIKQASVVHGPASLVFGYLLAGVGAFSLFFALLGINSSRCPPVLLRLGRLSYGLYVFHETGFFLANALARHAHGKQTISTLILEKIAALAIAVALAAISYRYWELPFLRLKQRWSFVPTREAT